MAQTNSIQNRRGIWEVPFLFFLTWIQERLSGLASPLFKIQLGSLSLSECRYQGFTLKTAFT